MNELIYLTGAYTPVTMEGTVVVDGILASCYASVDHDLAHFSMKPMQWYPGIIQWIFGNNIVMHEYVRIAKSVGRYIIPNNHLHVTVDDGRK